VRLGPIGAAATLALVVAVSACSRPVASPSASPPAATGVHSAPASPSVGPSQTPVSRDLVWYALPQADDLFRGAGIASMAGGPAGFVILGNDRATGGLMSWTSTDGDGWVRHWLPGETFEGGTAASLERSGPRRTAWDGVWHPLRASPQERSRRLFRGPPVRP
jgi:hypothetical protein